MLGVTHDVSQRFNGLSLPLLGVSQRLSGLSRPLRGVPLLVVGVLYPDLVAGLARLTGLSLPLFVGVHGGVLCAISATSLRKRLCSGVELAFPSRFGVVGTDTDAEVEISPSGLKLGSVFSLAAGGVVVITWCVQSRVRFWILSMGGGVCGMAGFAGGGEIVLTARDSVSMHGAGLGVKASIM